MDPSNIHPLPKRSTRRPTLFANHPSAAEEDFPHSMLAPLRGERHEPRASASRRRPGGRHFAVAVAILCAGLAAMSIGRNVRSDRLAAAEPIPAVTARSTGSVPSVAMGSAESASAHASTTTTSARIEPAAESHRATAAASTTVAAPAPPAVVAPPATAGGSEPAASAARPHAQPRPNAEAAARALPAPARTAESKPRSAKGKGDPDIDLVAAIIARLDRRGSEPSAPARTPSPQGGAAPAGVAARLQKCSAGRDPVEARQCRSKACDGRRGRIDACPASRAPRTSHRGGARDAAHG